MAIPKFRTTYDHDFGPRGDITFLDENGKPEVSLTVQSAAEECDINMIIDRANKGIYPPPSNRVPQFGDFSEFPDYQSAMNSVIQAQEAFSQLPAKMRERFGNDPAKLLSFLADPANRSEAESLGLVNPPVAPEAPVAPVGGGNTPPVEGAAP